MKEDLRKIIEHFGIDNQLRKFNEESFELIQAIIECENDDFSYYDEVDKYNKNHIAEEISDCLVLLKQFQSYYGITDEQINKNIGYKINRTLKRIEEEYYDK